MGPILFSYYEESLVSSNLKSKHLGFIALILTYIAVTIGLQGHRNVWQHEDLSPPSFDRNSLPHALIILPIAIFLLILGFVPAKFSDLSVPLRLDPILWLEFSSSFLNKKLLLFGCWNSYGKLTYMPEMIEVMQTQRLLHVSWLPTYIERWPLVPFSGEFIHKL